MKQSRQRFACGRAAGLALGGLLGMGGAVAQDVQDGLGRPWVADTSVAAVLQSRELDLGLVEGRGLPDRLEYELGFATREVAATGFLFDSLTISLSRADGTGSTILVTGDVFGLTIAPLAPGGLLSGGGISVSEVTPRLALIDGAAVSFGYSIHVQLPPVLAGQELRTRFDFFNNGDAVASRGYAMVVPEASTWVLGLMGSGLLWVGGRRMGGRP